MFGCRAYSNATGSQHSRVPCLHESLHLNCDFGLQPLEMYFTRSSFPSRRVATSATLAVLIPRVSFRLGSWGWDPRWGSLGYSDTMLTMRAVRTPGFERVIPEISGATMCAQGLWKNSGW